MNFNSSHATSPSPYGREALTVGVITLIGGILRLWGPGRLGLIHFDEGIYALSGLWAVSPRGLASLDPTLISYAPPGFPVLVGLAYLVLGVSDLSAILVSIATGTLTIAAIAWLARRTFGPGAGAAAAGLAAFSGFHVSFSRMALTDSSFLLLWIVGLGLGQRFLERPGLARSLGLGVGVGAAQLFKYNGWLVGAAVLLTAGLNLIVDQSERRRSRVLAVWGYGLLAALVAAVVYWPWFRFVETHGGYAALLGHHRSYLGGVSSWFSHWSIQLEQVSVLSGGPVWNGAAWLAACLACVWVNASETTPARGYFAFLLTCGLLPLVCMAPGLLWWIGIPWIFLSWSQAGSGERLLRVGWLGLSILTPFYHPYARLWLPLHTLGWTAAAGVLATVLQPDRVARGDAQRSIGQGMFHPVRIAILCGLLAVLQGLQVFRSPFTPGDLPGILAPSNSLRFAARQAMGDLPEEVRGLRALVRPSVTYYLGGRGPIQIEPNLSGLSSTADPHVWALLDSIQLRQEGAPDKPADRVLQSWEVMGMYSSQLNLPTLLDVDPAAARRGSSDMTHAPLWLLRPRSENSSR